MSIDSYVMSNFQLLRLRLTPYRVRVDAVADRRKAPTEHQGMST